MAKDKISEYSATNSANTVVGDIDIDEGCLPSGINNAIREVMTHLKDFSDGTSGVDVLNLQDDDASASIKIQAPAAVTTTTTFTLPDGDGTSGYALVTNGSGQLSWAAAGGISNVVEDTTPQLGGNLDTNGNDILFGDNDKAIFGAGSDLQIYHTGSNSYIQENGTGSLIILGYDTKMTATGAATYLENTNSGYGLGEYGVKISHITSSSIASEKLKTTSTGIDVTGTVTATDAVLNGTGAIKVPVGTTAQRPTPAQGQIRYNTTDGSFEGYDGSAWGAIGGGSENSFTVFEYTATASQTTFSGADDNAATLSYTAGNIQVMLNGVVLDPSDYTATNGTSVVLASGAALNDVLNIYAFTSFTVADTVSASTGGTFSANVAFAADATFGDNDKAIFGAGSDLQIYHDGSNSYVQDAGTGDLIIKGDYIRLQDSAGGNLLVADSNDAVQLYYGYSQKLATTSTGVDVTGTVTADGLDVTGTAQIGSDTAKVKFYSDSTYSGIFNGASLGSNENFYMGSGSLFFYGGGSERLRIDNSGHLFFATTANPSSSNKGLKINNASVGPYIENATNTTTAHDHLIFYNPNGTVGYIRTSGSSTTYATSSDYRLKENVTADWDATTRLKQLNPVRFNFIADADTTVDGFLAHEVQDIVPEAITGTKDAMRDEEYEVTPAVLDEDGNEVTPAVMGTRSVPDYQGIDQSKLVPLLVKTIQELEARIAALETA